MRSPIILAYLSLLAVYHVALASITSSSSTPVIPSSPTASFNPSSFQGAVTAGPVLPPANPDAEPSNIPQMLAQLPKMNATMEQANDGNVTITLSNVEGETLYIDPNFSFLSPGVESLVLNLTNAQGVNLTADAGYEAADADFVSPMSLDNLTAVLAGQNVSRALNLSEIFNIPKAGTYTLSIQPFIMGGNETMQSNWSNIDNYVIAIQSTPTPVKFNMTSNTVIPGNVVEIDKSLQLTTGPHMSNSEFSEKVKVMDKSPSGAEQAPEAMTVYPHILNCGAQDTQTVITFAHEAVTMASNAVKDTRYDWIRTLYFGQGWPRNPAWRNVLIPIVAFNISDTSNPTGVSWICDRASERGMCPEKGVLAYTYRFNNGVTPDYIVLCDMFFDLPDYNYWFPGYTWFQEQPYDKPTLILHELTHSASVVGPVYTIDVPDKTWYSWFQGLGLWSGGCYRHSCAARLAAGKGWDGYGPLNNAQNFAWYAKYIRDCMNGNGLCWFS